MFKRAIATLGIIAGIVMASPPPGAGVEVALLYAPNLALGGLNGPGEIGPGGVKARVTVAASGPLRLNAGVGYGLYRYRSKYVHYAIWEGVGEIPIWAFSFGGDIGPDRGRWRPYGAFGFAAAVESVDVRHEKRTDFTPGIYAGGGASFRLGDGLAFALEPRYTYYFDKVTVIHDLERFLTGIQTDDRFQCVELLIGFSYHF